MEINKSHNIKNCYRQCNLLSKTTRGLQSYCQILNINSRSATISLRIVNSNSRNFITNAFLRLFRSISRGAYPQGIATSNPILLKFVLFVIFAFFASNAIAQETSNIPFEQEYIDSFSKDSPPIEKTPLYKKGIETIYLNSLYKDEKIKWKGNKELKFKIPDYQKALEYFLKSFYNEHNLASAFMAAKVIEFSGRLNTDIKNQILYFALMEKLAQKNNCKALEREATYYYYGKGGLTQDKKTAKKIAKKASSICSDTIFKNSIDYILNKE